MKQFYKISLIALSTAIILTCAVTVFYILIPDPPIGEVEYALVTLQRASQSKANRYAKNKYYEAKACYDSAMKDWNIQNKRFILFRDYKKTILFAQKSAKIAKQATYNSVKKSRNLIITVKEKIDSLNELITNTNELFSTLPLSQTLRKNISKGKILLKESEIAFEKGDYLYAAEKIDKAEQNLKESCNTALSNLENYFCNQPYWTELVNQTIKNSARNNSTAIIVDKFSHKLIAYQGGTVKYELNAEFGKNWIGPKRLKGDKATPEGIYTIKSKVPKNKTKYFRALLLNYPNKDDVKQFNRDKTNGNLPINSQIGGLIEIHGNGGKGTDWTDGCIALSDSDMLKIYNISTVGTTVVIVGSTTSFNSIIQSLNIKHDFNKRS